MHVHFVALLAGGAVSIGVLVATRMRRRAVAPVAVALAAVFALAFIVAYVAAATDYHDADGFIDCYPDCATIHNVVKATLFAAPPIVIFLVIVAVASRRRSG